MSLDPWMQVDPKATRWVPVVRADGTPGIPAEALPFEDAEDVKAWDAFPTEAEFKRGTT